ncbi:DUF4235 domain-containing protein [Naumannella halotolerans]|uniref:Uncharacterized protein DUF4235 n=1 Tax=Naumannella halotolerans TaxID=993414 RepID=A0A4R7J736_9ACTN|nr:DUF4235 domain-containing protein [Naumannella halotolerans]TDT33231.1 uncharacterized protein DUF4235 [Naumannella halotolerans]
MEPSKAIFWKLYAGVIGAATTFAAQKAVTGLWKTVTGEEPPAAGDPDAPLTQSIIWALSSAVGIGLTQLLINRFTARRWRSLMGDDTAPKVNKIKFNI